jgi:hypothetical protein
VVIHSGETPCTLNTNQCSNPVMFQVWLKQPESTQSEIPTLPHGDK